MREISPLDAIRLKAKPTGERVTPNAAPVSIEALQLKAMEGMLAKMDNMKAGAADFAPLLNELRAQTQTLIELSRTQKVLAETINNKPLNMKVSVMDRDDDGRIKVATIQSMTTTKEH